MDSFVLHDLYCAKTAAEIESLIAACSNIETRNHAERTMLNCAAYNGKVDVVKSLIAAGANVDARDCDGRTPLHRAALAGEVAVIGVLIGAGADVNARDIEGNTPLYLAFDQTDVVCVLIEHKADVNARCVNGRTVLHPASLAPDSQLVAQLLACGANPNIPAVDGTRPLHWACSAKTAKLLLASGADPALRCNQGYTALENAKQYLGRRRREVAKVLENC